MCADKTDVERWEEVFHFTHTEVDEWEKLAEACRRKLDTWSSDPDFIPPPGLKAWLEKTESEAKAAAARYDDVLAHVYEGLMAAIAVSQGDPPYDDEPPELYEIAHQEYPF